MSRCIATVCGLSAIILMGLGIVAEETQAPSSQDAVKKKLSSLQYLVGGWKGVGQPIRGSTKDNWIEQADWAWDFSAKTPALIGKLKDARYFTQLRISAVGRDAANLELSAVTPAGEQVKLAGKTEEDGRVVFTTDQVKEGTPGRVTVRSVANGDRLIILYERPSLTGGNWTRMADVGSTRVGSGFGQGNTQVECVVTGGLGTIPVTHEGKTYYVCCAGCRDLFNERPAEILAEYRARKEAESKKNGVK